MLLAAIFGILLSRVRGPAPKPASASPADFSAERALSDLRQTLAGDAPHPVGSRAHETVLSRLAVRFAEHGYQPTIQRTFACNAYLTCAEVANVIAELPGDARAETLLVTAHYDSVGAGPGASDDGVGFATALEVARAIRGEHFRNTVRFVITDGEEAGLLGAEGLVRDSAAMQGAAAAINIEARGTAGPSLLFETSAHNRWLASLIARALPRPATSSLFYEVYRLLPNDTDLTVFRRAGLAAVNFGTVGRVAHYHTPLDNLKNVNLQLLQDHGDHALAMTREMANADLRQSTDDNAVFFDVLSLVTVWWPQSWTMVVAAATLISLLFAAVMRLRTADTTVAMIAIGIASFFGSLLLSAALATIATWLGSLRAPAANWLAQPGPSIAAAWLIGVAASILVAMMCVPRAGFEGLFLGHAICWSALAIALARFLPGASYIALVPAAVFALTAFLSALVGADELIGSIVCAVLAATLHFPVGLLLYDALGRPALVAIAVDLALIATTFTPIVVVSVMRRAALTAMFTTAAVCVLMQLAIPAYTVDSPRRLNIRYVDDGKSTSWEADAVTLPLRRAARFRVSHLTLPWLTGTAIVQAAPAPPLPVQPPEALVTAREPHRLVVKIRSIRGAQRISLTFRLEGDVTVRVNGVLPPSDPHKQQRAFAPGWRRVAVWGAQEATIELIRPHDMPVDAFVSDFSFGLPHQGYALAAARDQSLAVPSNDGDGVLIMRRVRL